MVLVCGDAFYPRKPGPVFNVISAYGFFVSGFRTQP